VRGVYPIRTQRIRHRHGYRCGAVRSYAYGRVDRILLKVPGHPVSRNGPGASAPFFPRELTFDARRRHEREPQDARSLSLEFALARYISLVVGAFLIYNAISVSVVRRRPDIGIVRALGAGRAAILAAFVGEAVLLRSLQEL